MKILLVNAKTFICDSYPNVSVLPETAIVRSGTPFFIPDNENRWQFNFGIGAVITRLGKSIEEHFAHRYWEKAILTARVQPVNRNTNKDLPPLGFDGSLLTGTTTPYGTRLNITTTKLPKAGNPSTIIKETTFELPENHTILNRCIVLTSRFFSLHTGDIVMIEPDGSQTTDIIPDTRITVAADGDVIMTHKIK